jgi:hypothetical protein
VILELIAAHCLADYPLQGDFMARGKNPVAPLPDVPWWLILASHAAIHAGAVALFAPGFCAGIEFVSHFAIDYAKCRGWLGSGERGFIVDQAAHVAFKLFYVAVA